MDRPTKIYPLPPKPEWFQRHTTNISSVAKGVTIGVDDISSAYTKMRDEEYLSYITAHKTWLATIREIDIAEHDAAVARRALDHFKEVPVNTNARGQEISAPATRVVYANAYAPKDATQPIVAKIECERKIVHPPTLSQKPHKAEKRQAKIKLVNAKTKTAAVLIEHKATVEEEVREDRKKVITSVEKLKVEAPLHSQELRTAKSANLRVQQIKLGSPDVVGNVVPEDGWKVVTRKKGSFLPLVAEITTHSDNEPTKTVQVQKDPVASYKSVLEQAVRQPHTTG